MAEHQKERAQMLTEEKTTTVHNLNSDCFLSILAFGNPLDLWEQRLTCSDWHDVVPVALSRVIHIDESIIRRDGNTVLKSDLIRQVVDLCPNLERMQIYFYNSSRGKMVTNVLIFIFSLALSQCVVNNEHFFRSFVHDTLRMAVQHPTVVENKKKKTKTVHLLI